MKTEYQMEVDYLALGLTRAPSFMGVPLRLFFSNVVVCALLCIDFHTFLGIPLFFLIHLILLRQSIKDQNFFSIWIKSLIKTSPVLNYWFWGKTNSYEPW
ncbi:MAG TPA: VirB3 family type IV secretion system protein [Gammaproteobacteria bacterium]|nr:VirB3 family type IV secretion system protein [Gammaproteobacteria bacterium]